MGLDPHFVKCCSEVLCFGTCGHGLKVMFGSGSSTPNLILSVSASDSRSWSLPAVLPVGPQCSLWALGVMAEVCRPARGHRKAGAAAVGLSAG